MRSLLILTLLAAGPPPAVALRTRRLLRGPAYEVHAISSALSARRLDKVALDNNEIKTAVELWFEEKDEAKEKYGDIKDWDTSGVTDIGERLPRLPCK